MELPRCVCQPHWFPAPAAFLNSRRSTRSEPVLLLPVRTMENTRPLRILHIDDSDDDALVLSRVLRNCTHPTSLKWCSGAPEAIEFLEKAGPDEVPDVILCDIKMPIMNGHEFIRWLRQSRCKTVTVVVLSSSDLMEDIREAYALGANSFLIKPLAASEILTMMNAAVEYWRRCNLVQRRADV